MKSIDLNADVGEADNAEWAKSEAQILRYVSSANIACGGHAGDIGTMRKTIEYAKKYGVNVGAHPAYPDRLNFGRKSMTLGQDISEKELRNSLLTQIVTLAEVAAEFGVEITYVKPHGALYNDAVNDPVKAMLIASTIRYIDPHLKFMGGPNSEMQRAALNTGLDFIAEGFIDRRYSDDGHLRSRNLEGAILSTDAMRIEQALSLSLSGTAKTQSGQTLKLRPRSLCLHGDSHGAVQTAKKAKQAIEKADVEIRSFVLPNHTTPKTRKAKL